jgi:nucleoside-diphosphate-sugar epimerase
VLGRERLFEYFSREQGTPVLLFRLNYAVELRYGVVLDVAQKVWRGEPIDLTMGHVNVIWQGDANAYALRSLPLAASPPRVLNVTGPETISIRSLAQRLGALLGKEPRFIGEEAETALLSNAAQAHRLFGYPTVPLDTVVQWVAHWVRRGGPTWDKPTHYEVRDGRF